MFKDAADMSNCLMSGAHLIYDYNEFSNLLRQPINVQRKVTRKFTPMDFARECQFTQTQTIIRQNTKKIGLLSAAKYFWTGGDIEEFVRLFCFNSLQLRTCTYTL